MATRARGTKRKEAGTGLWMIGACGGVGSAVALGVAALGRRLAAPTGLVGSLPIFGKAGLVDPGRLVVGGHEIRSETLRSAVQAGHEQAGLFDEKLVHACEGRLREFQRNIRPGTLCGAGAPIRGLADAGVVPADRTAAAAIERLAADITAFRTTHGLEHVIVVNVASAEPPVRRIAAHAAFSRLSKELNKPGSDAVPTSSIYALAAIEAGCPFVNFTASTAIGIPAVRARADERGVPYMGNDGKTGESLVKSFLAPLFLTRNLKVLSWVGQNILGNRDGAVLADPNTRASKIRSKDRVLSSLTKDGATTRVAIEYVPSLVDWKVAWDFIHFEGFLNTRMHLQFTWHGSDSLLAAPLVIDLARFAEVEARTGRGGPMRHLACFFKDPIDAEDADHFQQWQHLVAHATGTANGEKNPPQTTRRSQRNRPETRTSEHGNQRPKTKNKEPRAKNQ